VKWIKFLAFGAIVAGLYGMLFAFEADVIRLCKQGGWYFLFPVGVAFVFSYFHGAFTGMFWDVLGVQAKQSK
jgi:hypothetical protein